MHARFSAILVAVGLAISGVAFGQTTTGTIQGRVVDAQGLAVPGAQVTVTGPQGARTFVTDAQGEFQAPFLTPGTYTVRSELQGFSAAEVRDVAVSLGQTRTVNLTMQIGGLTETVQVTGAAGAVDTQTTATGAVLSSEMLSRIPVGRRVSDTLYVAPGVSSGGTVGRANPSVSGGTGLDNLYVIDGVNISNAGYGGLGSYSIVFGSLGNATPFDFIQEVQIKTGGYEAEFGQSIGGVVNVVTKSGTNELRGSLFGYSRPDAFEGAWKQFQSVNGTINTTGTQVSDVGIEGGFPIVRDRLFAFGAINPSWERRTFVAPEGFPLQNLGEVNRDRNTLSYSAKLTWQASNAHRVDASFFGDPSEGEMGPQRASALLRQDTAAFSSIDYGGHNQTLRYDGVLSSNWLLEASFARADNEILETPSANEWNIRDRRVTPTRLVGGIGFYESNEQDNRQYSIKSTHIFGGHQVKYGFLFEDVDYLQGSRRTGPTFLAPDGRRTETGATIDILPDPAFGQIYRVVRANFNVQRPTEQSYWSLFLQDSWRPIARLTVNAGLRYEQQTLKGTIRELHTFQGGTFEDFPLKNNWAPRVGFTYDLLGNGRSKLYGNYGRFFARIPNDLAARALSADEGISRADYFDAQLTRPVPEGVLAAGVTRHYILAGAHPALIDEEAKLSYKDEFVAGFEWEAMTNTNVGVRYIFRTIGRALEDVAQLPVVGYDLGHPAAPTVEYTLTNPTPDFPTLAPELGARFEDPIHNYNAIELTVDRRFAENWMVNASYRWSRLRGTFEGFYREDNGQSDPGITSLYDFPTDDPSYTQIGVPRFGYRGDIRFLGRLGEGPLPLDRPHQLKLFGNLALDMGLSLGLGVNVSSGKPLTPFAANPAYTNGGEIPEGPRGSGIQTIDGFKRRTPVEHQVDFQASWALPFGGDRRLTLVADVFNVFNTRRTLDYDTWSELSFGVPNPDFGKPISQIVSGPQFQQPRQFRLGARFAF